MSRYEVVELPKDDRGRKMWGIYDHQGNQLVHARDEQNEPTEELLRFYMEYQAAEWIGRERYLSMDGHRARI